MRVLCMPHAAYHDCARNPAAIIRVECGKIDCKDKELRRRSLIA